jgi:threonine synthase
VLAAPINSPPYRVDPGRPGIWRYAAHLPLDTDAQWLSLGESMTPVIRSDRLAGEFGVQAVWLKLDFLTATGSFKDRAAAAAVAHALAHRRPGVVCASSGNAAAAVAAYAARAGIPAVIVVPLATPPGKLVSYSAYGARVVAVPGDYSASFSLARDLCREFGLANLATTYVNPHAAAALRSVAFDLHEQIGADIDWVGVPTGSGPLVHGVHAGFADLAAVGVAAAHPRLVAAQPAGCAPIAAAFDAGEGVVEAWGEVTTEVSGINDPLRGYAGDGTVTLKAVRASGGRAVAVSDEEIWRSQRDLAQRDGVFVEPAAAASVAGMSRLARIGLLSSGDRIVCLLTGHGQKTASGEARPTAVVDNVKAAAAALAGAGLMVE